MLPGLTPALFTKAGAAVGGGNDSFTKLLLHMDEVVPNVFPDSSLANHGNATVTSVITSATGGKFSGCGYFGGAGVLTFPNHADWDFGSGDFTIDWWEYRTTVAGSHPVLSRNASTAQIYQPWVIGFDESGFNKVYSSSNNASWDILSSFNIGATALNTWVHFAFVRAGSTYYGFRNGALTGTTPAAAAIPASAGVLSIGYWSYTPTPFYYIGNLDELRISKGIARWTAAFTPPTVPYS